MPNLSKLKSRLNIAAAVLALSSLNMEGGLDHLKAPFLSSNNNGELSEVTRLKCDFFSKLPDKVRCGLDPELSFHIDYSKATGLTKGEKEYYERQFATLRSFEEVDSTESSNVIEDGSVDAEQVQSERAMKISNWANVFLLAFKNHTLLVFATVKSGSIAIAASTLDSLLDLMAGEDHYFDVITNIVGLVAAVLGDKFSWWIDPIGAILLALYTISNWSKTVLENVVSLVGQSAPPEVLQKLTYLVLRYHPQITRIDTVRAYTCGVLYFVEVDIELPEDLPLKEAHAIGESLQIRIEELPEVERAFVHLDTECEHKPEHSVLSTLPSSQI
ncbi:hypothetical protein JHK82_053670 [Glycine max]|nr:hypothetical protein JHK85_054464 [Glycine max]KAG5083502.1 hypothetical protein JHK84_053540 [Glycine max]KAG5086273.1 hypothetical protein JHK82_053670 [Glycine max]